MNAHLFWLCVGIVLVPLAWLFGRSARKAAESVVEDPVGVEDVTPALGPTITLADHRFGRGNTGNGSLWRWSAPIVGPDAGRARQLGGFFLHPPEPPSLGDEPLPTRPALSSIERTILRALEGGERSTAALSREAAVGPTTLQALLRELARRGLIDSDRNLTRRGRSSL